MQIKHTVNGKVATNLKKNKAGYVEGVEEKRGRSVILISKGYF